MIKRLKKLPAVLIFMGILSVFTTSLFAQTVDPTAPTQPDQNIGNAQDDESGYKNSQEGLQLNAIYYHAKNPMAIINGKVVGVNEIVGDYKVAAIGAQSVKLLPLNGQGQALNLSLDNLEVKKFHRESTGNKT